MVLWIKKVEYLRNVLFFRGLLVWLPQDIRHHLHRDGHEDMILSTMAFHKSSLAAVFRLSYHTLQTSRIQGIHIWNKKRRPQHESHVVSDS